MKFGMKIRLILIHYSNYFKNYFSYTIPHYQKVMRSAAYNRQIYIEVKFGININKVIIFIFNGFLFSKTWLRLEYHFGFSFWAMEAFKPWVSDFYSDDISLNDVGRKILLFNLF